MGDSQGLDVKPQGDALSRLMLTVLAAVADFERDLIKERTHLLLSVLVAKVSCSDVQSGRVQRLQQCALCVSVASRGPRSRISSDAALV